ncbi:MAG: hypothetical protein A2Y63_01245 [Candidatus Riflebacteria bacterium RBG_13_59_9]|nr:MAG: hypothetical protein A2Y63_01245 [Candidatus Riflebacteria bacterium RBG_13_59_9]
MCFSAGASITAGVLLTAIGAETLRKVHKPEQIAFASIPIVFAFQQFSEGALWLTVGKPGFESIQAIATIVFLIMAQIIWPLLVPISVLLMEHHKIRKRILCVLIGVGALAAAYYAYSMIFFHAYANISNLHIEYKTRNQASPGILGIAGIASYLIATLVPFFISSIKRTYILGIIIGLSFIVSIIFFTLYLTSVWCFFAAVISFLIYYTIRASHRKYNQKA